MLCTGEAADRLVWNGVLRQMGRVCVSDKNKRCHDHPRSNCRSVVPWTALFSSITGYGATASLCVRSPACPLQCQAAIFSTTELLVACDARQHGKGEGRVGWISKVGGWMLKFAHQVSEGSAKPFGRKVDAPTFLSCSFSSLGVSHQETGMH